MTAVSEAVSGLMDIDDQVHHALPSVVHYASQSRYGLHGLRICTPVCMLVCANFMRIVQEPHDDVCDIFETHVIDAYMRAAHSLYEECFPDAREPVMMKSLLPLMNKEKSEYKEVAGMNYGPCESLEVDDMLVSGLWPLIRSRNQKGESSSALLITVAGHTTAMLFDMSIGRVYHFDPLPATMRDVTDTISILRGVAGDLNKPAMSYDGLLMLK